ncbi:MAG: lysophospholipid acyltransferase family protein [Rhodospirillales bacterium]
MTGLELLPGDGAALLASQHQSAFDTLVWLTLVPRPSYVVKQELTRIPLFGPMLLAAGMIRVDRAAGAAALRAVLTATEAARGAGRQILIFPRGHAGGAWRAGEAAAGHCRDRGAAGAAGHSGGNRFRATLGPARVFETSGGHSYRYRGADTGGHEAAGVTRCDRGALADVRGCWLRACG